jgi:hypothetical protein
MGSARLLGVPVKLKNQRPYKTKLTMKMLLINRTNQSVSIGKWDIFVDVS